MKNILLILCLLISLVSFGQTVEKSTGILYFSTKASLDAYGAPPASYGAEFCGAGTPRLLYRWDGGAWVEVNSGGDVSNSSGSIDNQIARYDGTTGKIIQNSIIEIDDNAELSEVSAMQFNLAASVAHAEGKMHWDADSGTVEIGMPGGNVRVQIGQETVIRVTNSTGGTLTNGQAVYINGSLGNKPTIALANAGGLGTASVTGVLTEDIANNNNGYVTTFGLVRDLNTSAFAAGAVLWLDVTDGVLTDTRPAPPNTATIVGVVVVSHATTGIILVSIARVPRIVGLSDVNIPSPVDGDVISYDNTSSTWVSGQPALNITVSDSDNIDMTLTGSDINSAVIIDPSGDNILTSSAAGLKAVSGGGSGDVTASANLGDNFLIRGDGAIKGVQNSNISIDDSDNISDVNNFASTGDIQISNTTFANQKGIISKGGSPFLHDFNYGNNGTVTTTGNNVFIGENSGNFTMGSTATAVHLASNNTGIGENTLSSNTLGYYNTAIGFQAGRFNTTGFANSFIGPFTGQANTTGSYNVFISREAGEANISGSYNSFFGFQAGNKNTSGGSNIAIGWLSGFNNTTASNNVFIGTNSGQNNTTGGSNLFIGFAAGSVIADGSPTNTTGDFNVFLGRNTRAKADNDQNQIVIGYAAIGNGSNTVTIGNTDITDTYLEGNLHITGGATATLGTHVIDADQIVGATEDGYVETYDNGTGLVSLEPLPSRSCAEMYITSASPQVLAITTGVYSKIVGHSTDIAFLQGFTYATGTFTKTASGTQEYYVTASVSGSFGTGNTVTEANVFVNGVIIDKIAYSRKIGTGGDVGSAALSGLLSLTLNDTIDVRLKADNTDNWTTENLNFSVIQAN